MESADDTRDIASSDTDALSSTSLTSSFGSPPLASSAASLASLRAALASDARIEAMNRS